MSAAVAITWWGASAVELTSGGRRLVVDPLLHPRDGEVDYVLVTREDHDHCHEPTLQRLSGGARFQRLVAAPGCAVASQLDLPVPEGTRDLAYVPPQRVTLLHPKFARKPDAGFPQPHELTLDPFHVEATEAHEHDSTLVLGSQLWGKRRLPEGGPLWPAGTGRFLGPGLLPTLGFLVTTQGVGIWHPGDLQGPYDSQRELRGRVDVMLLPMASLAGAELSVIDNVRPRRVVPIHYRPAAGDGRSFPQPLADVPLTATEAASGRPLDGADPDVHRREIRALMDAGWYATPADPERRLRELAPQIEALGAELTVLEAGTTLALTAEAAR